MISGLGILQSLNNRRKQIGMSNINSNARHYLGVPKDKMRWANIRQGSRNVRKVDWTQNKSSYIISHISLDVSLSLFLYMFSFICKVEITVPVSRVVRIKLQNS